MSQSIFPGPIASQNNPPIEPEFFQPSIFEISSIAADMTVPTTTLVTTLPAFGVNNNYVVGQTVRFTIPRPFGIQQLNEQQGLVLTLPATNQFTVGINITRNYDAFIPVPTYSTTTPKVAAIGDINTGAINAGRTHNGTTIPGSFQNISPAVGG